MNASDFTMWLSGFVELHGKTPTPKQWLVICDHLNLALGKPTQTLPNQIIAGPDLTRGIYCDGIHPKYNPLNLNLGASGNGTPIQHRTC